MQQYIIKFDNYQIDAEEVPSDEYTLLIKEIEQKILDNLHLGFDPEVLEVLDDPDSTKKRLESIQSQIDRQIVSRLFGLANSMYFGGLKVGEVKSFYDVVMRLGMRQSKTLILALSLFTMSHDREIKVISARSLATMLLSRLISMELGYRRDVSEKAELAGLFYEVGKILIHSYQKSNPEAVIDSDFIECRHHCVGRKLIEKFKLPDYLQVMISAQNFRLENDSIDLTSVVRLAHSVVDCSFKKHGRLILEAPVVKDKGTVHISTVIKEQFDAIGLGEYIEIFDIKEDSC